MAPFSFQAHVGLVVLKQRDKDVAFLALCNDPRSAAVAHTKALGTQAALISWIDQPEETLAFVGVGGVLLLLGRRGLFGFVLCGVGGSQEEGDED